VVENLMEAQVPCKNQAFYVVCAREQGADLGRSSEEKFPGAGLVCFVQTGDGVDSPSLYLMPIFGGRLERLYAAGRLESSMGWKLCFRRMGFLVEILLPIQVKIPSAPHYVGDLVGSQWGYFQRKSEHTRNY